MGEKAVLRDTANRLTAEVRAEAAKAEAERQKARDALKHLDQGERSKAIIQSVSCICISASLFLS